MMFWGWGDGNIGAAGWAMMVIWALFWIAFIVALIFFIRHLVIRSDQDRWRGEGPYGSGPGEPGQSRGWHRSSNALNILEERYARGEIDQDEFLRRKADLLR